MRAKKKFWITRDLDGWLTAHEVEPFLYHSSFLEKSGANNSWVSSCYWNLKKSAFPEVTWENSPVVMKLAPGDLPLIGS